MAVSQVSELLRNRFFSIVMSSFFASSASLSGAWILKNSYSFFPLHILWRNFSITELSGRASIVFLKLCGVIPHVPLIGMRVPLIAMVRFIFAQNFSSLYVLKCPRRARYLSNAALAHHTPNPHPMMYISL